MVFVKIVLNYITENRIPTKWFVIKIYYHQNCVYSNGNLEISIAIHTILMIVKFFSCIIHQI
jgi:glutaminase